MGFVPTEVQFNCLDLTQVAVLQVLVCVAVCPVTWPERKIWACVRVTTSCRSGPFLKLWSLQFWSHDPVAFSCFWMAKHLQWIKPEVERRPFFSFTSISLKSIYCNVFRCWFPSLQTTSHQVTQTIKSKFCRNCCRAVVLQFTSNRTLIYFYDLAAF